MKCEVAQASRIGGRSYNEDRIGQAATAESTLLVLADGMGGHARGEVAAQMMVNSAVREFEAQTRAQTTVADPYAFLLDCIYAAHDAINVYAVQQQLRDPPRTTCVLALVQEATACWAHVGDSRLYHFDQERRLSRTRDHSAVQQMIDDGLLTEAQALEHPDRNRLYNAVGGYMLPDIEIGGPVGIQPGDMLLLCSDGLWSHLSDTEIRLALRRGTLDAGLAQLLDLAEQRGGPRGDNLSAIAMRCAPLETLPPDADSAPAGEIRNSGRLVGGIDVTRKLAEIDAMLRKLDEEEKQR